MSWARRRPARPKVPLAECRDCAAPIVFVQLDSGGVMPVNPGPNPERGNVACRVVGGRLHGFVVSRDRAAGPLDSWRMTPHAATCEARKRPEKPTAPDDPVLF